MNQDFWNKLPPDLQALVTKSMTGVEKEVGEAWDGLDVVGKKRWSREAPRRSGSSAEENAKFRGIGGEVSREHSRTSRPRACRCARSIPA